MSAKAAWTDSSKSATANGNNHHHLQNGNGNGVHKTVLTSEAINLDSEEKKIVFSWENIDVHLPPQGGCAKLPCCKKEIKKSHILDNVNGVAKPGELLAIMGASGAGKTTLLNVLNFRNRGDLNVSGDVKINGKKISTSTTLAAISGYVQQDELFIGTLTVKEHLIFQAMLRMDSSFTKVQKRQRVDDVLEELNLKKCETTRIGIPEKGIKGISGGERRRLAFASEIITNPGLLFCDEPTSGLDSFMALSVVESMKTLAREGKTIICTIHQPSSEIFDKFDKLCLLAEGRLAYMGSLNDGLTFFQSVGYPSPANYNPADHYIQTLAVNPADREKSLEVVKRVCDTFQGSKYNSKLNEEIVEANKPTLDDFDSNIKNRSAYKVNFFIQLVWLLWRAFLSKFRDVIGTQISVIQTIFIALILGLIFLQIKLDQSGIQNINGILFLMISNISFSTMFAVINSFPEELPIFYREHKNGMYRVISYYIAKITVDLPFFIILPLISTSIIYWMCGLNNDAGRFFIAVAIVILVGNLAVAFGSFISAAAPSVNVALGLSAPILVPLMIFSGIFLNNSSVPDYFIWMRYLSWFSYSYELLNINQWSDVTNIGCTLSNTTRCLTTGDQVLAQFSMNKDNYNTDWIALSVLLVGWRVLTFLILLLKSYLNK